MNINPNSPILVTGGSGYIASWVISLLLKKGHTVHTTVRNISKRENYSHLLELEDAQNEKLKIFEADLMKEGSFAEAMNDCELVIHTASPFVVQGIEDPEKELIEPALKGTENILNSVNQNQGVKRVVLTSSVAAIFSDNKDILSIPGGKFTEEHWNTKSSLEHNPYSYSKTLAEKKAHEMVKAQNRWDLVVINPGFVLGPSLSKRTDSTSVRTVLQLCDGTFFLGVPELYFGVVDVRDVALAHILAGFQPSASGRHILCKETLPLMEISDHIKKKFPGKFLNPLLVVPYFLIWIVAPILGFTHKYIEENIGCSFQVDNTKSIQELGIAYTDFSKTIEDHILQLQRDKLL